MKIIRVLVVDDMAYNRDAMSEMLESSPFITVAGTASDGEEAIERVVRLKPDLITLDLEMPRMDGFTFLRWLMRSAPTPALVVSSRADDKSVIRALEFGAVDFLAKPVSRGGDLSELKRELIEKVKAYAPLDMGRVSRSLAIIEKTARERPAGAKDMAPGHERARYDVVAIGASTGGPPAIQAILTRLPEDFPAAIAVSQHMPPSFTRFFAERLDKISAIAVKEAEDGDQLIPGRALIAPGGMHMTFRREGGVRVALLGAGPTDKYVPSVDLMMKSAAMHFGGRALGVILTGMGSDGREGMGLIKGMGGKTIAESRETAVIYGMPKEAVEAGVVDRVVPLDMMAGEIIGSCI
jgi:two-component system chemotaxis response regulator CheB